MIDTIRVGIIGANANYGSEQAGPPARPAGDARLRADGGLHLPHTEPRRNPRAFYGANLAFHN